MKRMTTDNPQLNIERLLNTARAENNQAVLHLGDEVITLTEAVISEIERFVKSQLAADVVPVVHGAPVRKIRPSKHEWYEEVKTENGEILYRKHVYVDETNWSEYCPACGKRLCSRFKSYCPNCGTIMDLKDKQT